jgi:uncharacterized protein YdeI (YjbR/CyaY-like superfamily)
MNKKSMSLHFENSEKWITWLKENHKKDILLDMIFYKKGSGKSSIEYKDALEIALCYGWIDSRIKKIDEIKYVRRFSKRTQKSRWSLVNQNLMEKLIKENKVLPEKIDDYNKARAKGLFETSEEKNNYKNMKIEIPQELIEKLKESKIAKHFFENLDEKSKFAYCMFIKEPKKEDTRNKRLDEMIRKLEEGWKLPYFRPVKKN